MKHKQVIVGVRVVDRVKHAREVQQVLTDFGCSIKVRLGLHEATPNACATAGLILLEMLPDARAIKRMTSRLKKIRGVEVRQMNFVL